MITTTRGGLEGLCYSAHILNDLAALQRFVAKCHMPYTYTVAIKSLVTSVVFLPSGVTCLVAKSSMPGQTNFILRFPFYQILPN